MQILFYANPLIANGDPMFFAGAVRHKLIPLARACQKLGHHVTLSLPDTLAFVTDVGGLKLNVIDTPAFSKATELTAELDFHLYKDGESSPYIGPASAFYRSSVGFEPDMIFLWENCSEHLRAAFPNSKIVHLMPGFLGRLPYPELVYFDTRGLFRSSRMYSEIDRIIDGPDVSEEAWGTVQSLRAKCEPLFDSMDRARSLVDSLASKHSLSSLALVPMQFSRHFNFRVDTPYESQAEFLADVVHRYPQDTGLLVTQYISNKISDSFLSPELVHSLEARHPNVLYDPQFDTIDSISQFLLPWVDRVITCSSSVGLQGILYEKAVETAQDTYISRVVRAAQDSSANRQKLLSHLLLRSSVVFARLLEPQFLQAFLQHIIENGDVELSRDLSTLEADYGLKLLNSVRLDRAIKKVGPELRTGRGQEFVSPSVVQAVEASSVVSFDIFDTLIERPLAQPSDLFLAVEKRLRQHFPELPYIEFSRARSEAEQIAKSELSANVEEVTLKEIYDRLRSILGLSAEISNAIQEIELQLERELLTQRPIGKRLYELARAAGKRVIYASDMYLPEGFIIEALRKNGYEVDQNLYLSCSIGKKKKTGTLFHHICGAEGVEFAQVVHFGDNSVGDESVPQELGIKAYRIPRSVDRMRNHPKYELLFTYGRGNRSLHESATIYLIARRLFDNPFSPPADESYFNQSAVELGYNGFGPCVADFALWLGARIRTNDNDGVFFIARDGRVVMEVFDQLFPDLADRTHYVFGSRRMLRVSYPPQLPDIFHAIGNLNGTSPADLLARWYGWHSDDPDLNEPVTEPEHQGRARAAIIRELPALAALNSSNAAFLEQYAKESGMLDAKRPAIVEIGYAGTIQEGFARSIKLKTRGYYFILLDTADARMSEDLPMEGFAGHLVDRTRHWHSISQNGFLYETLFCSDEATITGLKLTAGKIDAVREESAYDQVRRSFIRQVHFGARSYARDMHRLLAPILDLCRPDPELGGRVLNGYLKSPSASDAALLEGVVFANNFKDGSYRYVVPPRGELGRYKAGIVKPIWPVGTDAFLTSLPASNGKPASAYSSPLKLAGKPEKITAPTPGVVTGEDYEKAYRVSGKPAQLRHAAEYYADNGQRSEAIRVLIAAREQMPNNKRLRRRLLVLQYPLLKVVLGENRFDPDKRL